MYSALHLLAIGFGHGIYISIALVGHAAFFIAGFHPWGGLQIDRRNFNASFPDSAELVILFDERFVFHRISSYNCW